MLSNTPQTIVGEISQHIRIVLLSVPIRRRTKHFHLSGYQMSAWLHGQVEWQVVSIMISVRDHIIIRRRAGAHEVTSKLIWCDMAIQHLQCIFCQSTNS